MKSPERIFIVETDTPQPRLSRCPGATLVVDRAGYRECERNGVRWATELAAIPVEGKAECRVFCDAAEEVVHRNGTTYRTGRCNACATMEKAQRQLLKSQRGGT